jgi:hypothetical protein
VIKVFARVGVINYDSSAIWSKAREKVSGYKLLIVQANTKLAVTVSQSGPLEAGQTSALLGRFGIYFLRALMVGTSLFLRVAPPGPSGRFGTSCLNNGVIL